MRILGFEIRRIQKNTYNRMHPDYKTLIEYTFTINDVEYFQYKDDRDMPPLRRTAYEQFLREAELRMNSKDALELLNLTEDAIEKSKATDAIILIRGMKYQIEQFMEMDTFYRLFSCLFFTSDEDLTTYDYTHNDIKIEAFKKEPVKTFFFIPHIKGWLPQLNITDKDLEVYLSQSKNAKNQVQKIKSKYLKER